MLLKIPALALKTFQAADRGGLAELGDAMIGVMSESGGETAGVPAEWQQLLAAELGRLSPDELDALAGAASGVGLERVAELLEDLADAAAAAEARADPRPGIPWDQLKADMGLS